MPSLLDELIDALRCLPGIGPKSAQRMVFFLLQKQKQKGLKLAKLLQAGLENIKPCKKCRNFTDHDLCNICQDSNRNYNTLCIVEGPADLIAIEQTKLFKGKYFVLLGKISPLDGIGPQDLGLELLANIIKDESVEELIIAMSPTIEAQTTVYYIKEACKGSAIKISQLAHGIPSGGELEYLDLHTIGTAIRNRNTLLSNHD
jgi:recombination protein RecR